MQVFSLSLYACGDDAYVRFVGDCVANLLKEKGVGCHNSLEFKYSLV